MAPACAMTREPSASVESEPGSRGLERETGFEPATSTLARSHSTTELFPPCGLDFNLAAKRHPVKRPGTPALLNPATRVPYSVSLMAA